MYVHISQSQKKCCLFPRYAVEYLDTAVIAHNSYKLQGLRNRSCLFSLQPVRWFRFVWPDGMAETYITLDITCKL